MDGRLKMQQAWVILEKYRLTLLRWSSYLLGISVSSETIGVRYMKKSRGLDTYFLYECMGTVLLVAEFPNRKKCSSNLFARFMHGGFSSIVWLSDILWFLPRISLIDFQCDLGLPWVAFNLSLWYLFLAALNTNVNWFLYALYVSRKVIGHFFYILSNLCFSLILLCNAGVIYGFCWH